MRGALYLGSREIQIEPYWAGRQRAVEATWWFPKEKDEILYYRFNDFEERADFKIGCGVGPEIGRNCEKRIKEEGQNCEKATSIVN